MTNLRWFAGIDWDTPVRQIGWTWVALAVASIIFVTLVVALVREWP